MMVRNAILDNKSSPSWQQKDNEVCGQCCTVCCDFSPWPSSAMVVARETKFDTKVI